MTVRATNRWRGIAAVTFAAVAVGVIAGSPPALLVGVVGVAYAGYARFGSPPEVAVDIEHRVSEAAPDPGDPVTVTVTVTNEGDAWLPDLRVIDGVPDAVEVVDGAPRIATALRPGARTEFSYTVEAVRGRHAFESAQVVARDASGAWERETRVPPGDDEEFACVPPLVSKLDGVPLRAQTAQHTGRITTNTAGEGVEFHATREYRRGDALTRVDWKRRAKTGELATIQFHEERAAVVVLLVDVRSPAYVSDGDGTSAVEHAVFAAGQVGATLLDEGDNVGLAAYGPEWRLLPPGLGRDHRLDLRDALALDPAFAPTRPDRRFVGSLARRRLCMSLSGDAQVFAFSPLVDDDIVETLRQLEALGHAVTVVSPNVVGDDTPGATVARLERTARLRTLRSAGVRAVDWNPRERSLAATLADAERGWRR